MRPNFLKNIIFSTPASSHQEFMLVTSSMRGNIYQMDMKTLHYKRIPANVRTNPIAIDYDHVDGRIYWTDVTDKEIRSAFLNGTDNRLVRGWAKRE